MRGLDGTTMRTAAGWIPVPKSKHNKGVPLQAERPCVGGLLGCFLYCSASTGTIIIWPVYAILRHLVDGCSD